jgi:hypothetical protein
MAYPGMAPEVFQNANIALLACQLFIMVTSLIVSIILSKKAAATPQRIRAANTPLAGSKL